MKEEHLAKAKEVYDLLCRTLEERDWHFDKYEEDLVIKSGIKGDDFPIKFIIRVDPETQLITFHSWMPFDTQEDKRVDMALAVCAANNGLLCGSFDYDITDGSIDYRFNSSFRDSIIGPDLFEYMILTSALLIDKYNDKFFMVSKGMITVQDFIKAETEGN